MKSFASDSIRCGNLSDFPVEVIYDFFGTGGPFIRQRHLSDYWILQMLFCQICPVISQGGRILAAAICFANKDASDEIYIQDFLVSDEFRGSVISEKLLHAIEESARKNGYAGLWLTSEADNKRAVNFWTKNGFTNAETSMKQDGVFLTRDLKGAGKHRGIFRKLLNQA